MSNDERLNELRAHQKALLTKLHSARRKVGISRDELRAIIKQINAVLVQIEAHKEAHYDAIANDDTIPF